MPRLKLCGAHLLAKLMREILDAIERLHFDVYCWTDAKIVIRWLADHPCRWTTFVATRTSSILTLLPGVPWQHVKSGENPADLTTRRLTPSELRDSLLWWRGPDWLTKDTVPEPPDYDDTPSELPDQRAAYKATFITQKIPEEVIDRFSSYQHLLRVLCYCLRFFDNSRRVKPLHRNQWITTLELQRCRTLLLKVTQVRWFQNEIEALQENRSVHRSSLLRQLNPFLDEDGLLRVGGRLNNASLSYNEKHPAILPKHSLLTRLLIRSAHQQTLHGGPQLTHS